MMESIDHLAIACFDTKKQIDWYCRVLGMHVIARNDQNPPSAIIGYGQTAREAAAIELMPATDAGAKPETAARFAPGIRHFALRVTDFDHAFDRLSAAGVKFLSKSGAALGGGKVCSFRDPEGNELQIVER